MSDQTLETTAPAEITAPNFTFEARIKWQHDSLVKATMYIEKTVTNGGENQIQLRLIDGEENAQTFWARTGLASTNWKVSQFLLPIVNVLNQINGAETIAYGEEPKGFLKMQTPLMSHPYVEKLFKDGVEVYCSTTVTREINSNTGKEESNVRLRYLHGSPDGYPPSEEAEANTSANKLLNAEKKSESTQQAMPW